MTDFRSSNGLREAAEYCFDDPRGAGNALEWAADELDRLTATIKSSDNKTYAISETTHEDMVVRKRVYGILAWHVNRTHADLSDHDLALACFREYSKHHGHVLVDPNE